MIPPSGASPLRPPTQKQNLSMKEKRKKHSAPSRWSGQGHQRIARGSGKHLPELATTG